ncbi:MAG: aspartate/glutamate racemase family protein [Blastocatellia bacterium]
MDDGILRLFRSQSLAEAQKRFAEMIRVAQEAYGAELTMITCSAVPKNMLERLRGSYALPVLKPILKIDEPMARQAVAAGKRIGVVVTFPPTLEPTCKLLTAAAEEAGVGVDIVTEVSPAAYQALLANDHQTHDKLLLAAIKRLDEQKVDAIVLAQVSMARILAQLEDQVTAPVLSSLKTSLEAIREALKEKR